MQERRKPGKQAKIIKNQYGKQIDFPTARNTFRMLRPAPAVNDHDVIHKTAFTGSKCFRDPPVCF